MRKGVLIFPIVAFIIIILIFGSIVCTNAGKETQNDNPSLKMIKGKNLRLGINTETGEINILETTIGSKTHQWLNSPLKVIVTNEYTHESSTSQTGSFEPYEFKDKDKIIRNENIFKQKFTFSQKDSSTISMVSLWVASSRGIGTHGKVTVPGERVAHEVVYEFPVLTENSQIFTPGERGLMSVREHPNYTPVQYGTTGYSANYGYYVLPLVSVFDPESNTGLTIAVPADENIPHFQVEWSDSKILRIRLGHRGMGGGKDAYVRLRLYGHEADYRAVIGAYSDDFKDYFRPRFPFPEVEGGFWYQHIHTHPEFEELSRQNVRWVWTSFWLSHLGEYLPTEKEWYPFTYACAMEDGKPFGEMMNNDKIAAYIKDVKQYNIGPFAYLNLVEYGGIGGKNCDCTDIEEKMTKTFGNDAIILEDGKKIVGWGSSLPLNPRRDSAFRPYLMDQVKRHFECFPDLEGFAIDRLDWSCVDKNVNPYGFDFAHSDGLSMVGNKPAENLTLPIADALQEVVRIAHGKGKHVVINQYWRIEVMKNVDGLCHEFDFIRGLGYLSPYRYLTAWDSNNYNNTNDFIFFEAQMKRRLQFACFPQFIGHTYKLIQQAPSPVAADLLELYAPLFSQFVGKEQVLSPHCVKVTGPNEANLFKTSSGSYIVPVTSRINFFTRGHKNSETVTVVLDVPDTKKFKWAHVYSVDVPPYRAKISTKGKKITLTLDKHCSSSLIVVGKGKEPALEDSRSELRNKMLTQFTKKDSTSYNLSKVKSTIRKTNSAILRFHGKTLEYDGKVIVHVNGTRIGELITTLPLQKNVCGGQLSSTPSSAWYTVTTANDYSFHGDINLPINIIDQSSEPPLIELTCGDEGVWFYPERVELLIEGSDGKNDCIGYWIPEFGSENYDFPVSSNIGYLSFKLKWCIEKG